MNLINLQEMWFYEQELPNKQHGLPVIINNIINISW